MSNCVERGKFVSDSRAVGSSFRLGGGGAEGEGRMPEEIFKFRVSEMPFPGLWGRFGRILMVRKQRFSTEIYNSVVLNGRRRI
jgi:hypothetical protein